MGKRIPPKGTPEYGRYWRDKRNIEEIDRVIGEVKYVTENTEPAREVFYRKALEHLQSARYLFAEGWRQTGKGQYD